MNFGNLHASHLSSANLRLRTATGTAHGKARSGESVPLAIDSVSCDVDFDPKNGVYTSSSLERSNIYTDESTAGSESTSSTEALPLLSDISAHVKNQTIGKMEILPKYTLGEMHPYLGTCILSVDFFAKWPIDTELKAVMQNLLSCYDYRSEPWRVGNPYASACVDFSRFGYPDHLAYIKIHRDRRSGNGCIQFFDPSSVKTLPFTEKPLTENFIPLLFPVADGIWENLDESPGGGAKKLFRARSIDGSYQTEANSSQIEKFTIHARELTHAYFKLHRVIKQNS